MGGRLKGKVRGGGARGRGGGGQKICWRACHRGLIRGCVKKGVIIRVIRRCVGRVCWEGVSEGRISQVERLSSKITSLSSR